MPRDRQQLLWLLEDRLSTVSRWLAARRVAGERHLEQLRAHLESVRRELRWDTAQSVRDALARARVTVEAMERGSEAPPPHTAIRREELEALRRHIELTATLLPHVSNLDDPGWRPAYEQYERSWDELHRVLEGRAAPPCLT
jgi:hypothetical protein